MSVINGLQPYVEFLPGVLQVPSRLVCHFGWNNETTQEFISRNFECLILNGGAFDLPDLGAKAALLKRLGLASSSNIKGLGQFKNIEILTVAWLPANGLDLSVFPRLKELSFEDEKKLEEQLPRQKNLETLSIDKFSGKDCSEFSKINSLRSLWLAQGSVRSLRGLEMCPRLESIELAYIRNLSDLAVLGELRELRSLSLQNLPKAMGEIEVNKYPNLEFLYVAECKQLTVSLSGLRCARRLKKLWLNVSSIDLDWLDIFELPDIEMVTLCAEENMPDDGSLFSLAEDAGKKLDKILHTGGRNKRCIQLYFSS